MGAKEGRLVGIKAIAAYLQTSDRNIYRWEKELGLPLHRTGGTRRRSVFAYVEELERWLRSHSTRSSKSRKRSARAARIAILGTAGAVAAIFLGWALIPNGSRHPDNPDLAARARHSANPISYRTENNLCQVLGPGGGHLWSYLFQSSDHRPMLWDPACRTDFRDIDGDGWNELAAVTYDRKDDRFRLTLFSHKGKSRWKALIRNRQSFGGLLLADGFLPLWLSFAENGAGETFILSTWRHARFVTLICRHDLEGRLLDSYIHTGHIAATSLFDQDGDGVPEIVFSATNNLLCGEGVIGVLPLEGFYGVCPPRRIEPEYRERAFHLKSYVADDPESSNELFYIRIRPPSPMDDYRVEYAFAVLDKLDSGHIGIFNRYWRCKKDGAHFGPYFVFDGDFRLRDILPPPEMLNNYPDLLKISGLDISMARAVELSRAGVMRWAEDGWVRVESRD